MRILVSTFQKLCIHSSVIFVKQLAQQKIENNLYITWRELQNLVLPRFLYEIQININLTWFERFQNLSVCLLTSLLLKGFKDNFKQTARLKNIYLKQQPLLKERKKYRKNLKSNINRGFCFDDCQMIYNHFENILRLFDVLPNFPFTTSETIAILTYKHGIYELPHELLNDLRLSILGNQEISEKCLNFIE